MQLFTRENSSDCPVARLCFMLRRALAYLHVLERVISVEKAYGGGKYQQRFVVLSVCGVDFEAKNTSQTTRNKEWRHEESS